MSEDTLAVAIPEEGVKPETLPPSPEKPPRINWAKKKATVEKFLSAAKAYWTKFDGQAERASFLTLCDDADRMYRCSKTKDTSKDQHQPTLANYPSTSFWQRINMLHIEHMNVMFQGDALPVVFDQYPQAVEYNVEDGKLIADQMNLLEAYTFEADSRVEKIKEADHFTLKYGNLLCSMQWDYRKEKRQVRNPDGSFEEKEVTVADHPTFATHDIKDAWFDAKIDDMDRQRCIITRARKGIEKFYGLSATGEYLNVENIGREHAWVSDNDSVMSDRQANAGADYGEEPTGEIGEWNVLMFAPIDEKGRWDERKNPPVRVWGTFAASDITSNNPVCVRLEPWPYAHKRSGFKLLHWHRDDKGAFHVAPADILGANYEEERVTVCQWEDNKTQRNKPPFDVEKGAYYTTDFTFNQSQQRIFLRKPGASRAEQIKIEDITPTMTAHLGWIKADGDGAVFINKPLQGQTIGNRAAATAERQAYEQSLKPMVESAWYFSDQLLVWMAGLDYELWQQFYDPNRTLAITHDGIIKTIEPAKLYGPLKVRVVAVKNYENQAMRKMEETQLLSQAAPIMVQAGMKKELTWFLKQVFKGRRYDGVESVFNGGNAELDAERNADRENDAMLFMGENDMPQPGENHEAHLRRHRMADAMYGSLPKEEQVPANYSILKMHMAATENLIQQDAQAAMSSASGVPQEPGAPQPQEQAMPGGETELSGEQAGDMMGAQAGSMGNPGG